MGVKVRWGLSWGWNCGKVEIGVKLVLCCSSKGWNWARSTLGWVENGTEGEVRP